jgi:hypothetical protein
MGVYGKLHRRAAPPKLNADTRAVNRTRGSQSAADASHGGDRAARAAYTKPRPMGARPETSRWLNRSTSGIALASLCSDVSHELATAVLPTVLLALGAGPAAGGARATAGSSAHGVRGAGAPRDALVDRPGHPCLPRHRIPRRGASARAPGLCPHRGGEPRRNPAGLPPLPRWHFALRIRRFFTHHAHSLRDSARPRHDLRLARSHSPSTCCTMP